MLTQNKRLETAPQLLDALNDLEIDSTKWKQFPFAKLVESIQTQKVKAELCHLKGRETILVTVHSAVITVVFRFVFFFELELYEYAQYFEDGTIKKRDFRGIAETENIGESDKQAAQRLLSEELGQSAENFRYAWNYTLIDIPDETLGPMPSEKWDGLTALFHRHKFLCPLHIWNWSLFRWTYKEVLPETKTSPAKTIVFRWKFKFRRWWRSINANYL